MTTKQWGIAPGQLEQNATSSANMTPDLGNSYQEYLANHTDWANGLSQVDRARAGHGGFLRPYTQAVYDHWKGIESGPNMNSPGGTGIAEWDKKYGVADPIPTHRYDPSKPMAQPYTPTAEENTWRYQAPGRAPAPAPAPGTMQPLPHPAPTGGLLGGGFSSGGNPWMPTVGGSPVVPGTPTNPATYAGQGIGPTQGSVRTADHLNYLLSQNSPYMQNAAFKGAAVANQRGLLNSSLAAGHAQRAAIEAAMPIAQDDAAFYKRLGELGYGNQLDMGKMSLEQQYALQRMGYGNELDIGKMTAEQRNLLERMGFGNELDLTKMTAEQRNLLERMGYGNELDLTKMNVEQRNLLDRMGYGNSLEIEKLREASSLDLRNAEFLKNMDTESRAFLMGIESAYARQMQYDASIADAYRQGMNSIAIINTNPELSPEQQQKATRDIANMLADQLQFSASIYGGQTPESQFQPQPVAGGTTAPSTPLGGFLAANPQIEQAYYRESAATRANETLAQYAYRYAVVNGLNPPPELRP